MRIEYRIELVELNPHQLRRLSQQKVSNGVTFKNISLLLTQSKEGVLGTEDIFPIVIG